MKKDILIKVNSKTSKVYLPTSRLGINYENLQGKLIVSFEDEFVDGICYLEIKRNNETGYLEMQKVGETYQLEIKSSLLNEVGQIDMQLRITESGIDEEIPIWKSNIFYLMVDEAINSISTIPEEYPLWIDNANARLIQFDNIDISASKVGTTATVTVTKKDGTTQEVEIFDGEKGDTGDTGNGISRIYKTSTHGLTDTYTIEYTDGTTTTFDITNGEKGDIGYTGNGIARITKTSTSGLIDTYTIEFTNGTNTTFNVTNGEKGNTGDTGNGISRIIKTSTSNLTDTYTIEFTDGTDTTFNVENGKGITSIVLTSSDENIDTYTINFNDGTTSTFTVTNSTVTDQEFDKLTNEVDKYKTIYNVLPKVSGEGTNIELKDTGNAMLVFDSFNGDTSQKTTTGKQLFDKDNQVKVQVNSEGTLRYGIIVDAPNKKVSISAKSWNNSIAVKQLINGTYGDFLNINSNTTFGVVDKLIIYSTSDTAKLDSNIEELQVEINDVPTNYESFTGCAASPSPEYPQPFKVVTGEQNVKISGKNLFDKDNDVTLNTQASFNGTEDNEFTTSTNNIRTLIITRVPSNSEITLSINNDNYIQSRYFICQLKTPTIEAGKNERWYTGNSTIVTTNKTNYLGIVLDIKKNGTTVNSTQEAIDEMKFQIEEGSTATSYVPYQSQTYPLSLGNIELARIGSYKDYIFKNEVGSPYYNADLDLNGWYLHNEINKVVFDGTEDGWVYYAGGGAYKRFELSINDIIQYTNRGNVLANYFKYLGTDIINEPGNIFSLNKKIYLYPETSISSVGQWENWLSTHKTEVYYPLENSTNTKITDTTLVSQLENINNNARSYKDTTYIICSSESEDNETIQASVTALKDISTLFSNFETRLEVLESEV